MLWTRALSRRTSLEQEEKSAEWESSAQEEEEEPSAEQGGNMGPGQRALKPSRALSHLTTTPPTPLGPPTDLYQFLCDAAARGRDRPWAQIAALAATQEGLQAELDEKLQQLAWPMGRGAGPRKRTVPGWDEVQDQAKREEVR